MAVIVVNSVLSLTTGFHLITVLITGFPLGALTVKEKCVIPAPLAAPNGIV